MFKQSIVQSAKGWLMLMLAVAGVVLVALSWLPLFGEAQTITTVSMVNDSFRPQTLTVPAGTTVLWLNNDYHYHSVTSSTGAFDSGTLYQNNTFQYTFSVPGTYYYYCRFHGSNMTGMWGVVNVTGSTQSGSSGYYGSYNPYTYGNSYSYPYQNYSYQSGSSYYPYTSNQYSYSYQYPYSSYSSPASSYSYYYPYSGSLYMSYPYSNYSNYNTSSYNTAGYWPRYQQTMPASFNLSCANSATYGSTFTCTYSPSFYSTW